MLLLCLDSSAAASVAVVDTTEQQPQILARWETQDTRSHAEVLTPAVEQVMAGAGVTAQELNGVLVGTGPGPFTGLRAGLATARTLGFAWGLPVHGMCSLDAVANDVAALPDFERPTEFVVATDARRREVYSAVYRTERDGGEAIRAVLVSGPSVGPAAELPDLPAYGRGAGLYAQDLPQAVLMPVPGAVQENAPTEWQPNAASLGLAAAGVVNSGGQLSTETSPLYLRESDAKVPGPRKKATA